MPVCSWTAVATSAEVTEPNSFPSAPGLRLHRDDLRHQLLRDLFGRAPILGVANVAGAPHRRGLLDVAVGRLEREALRHEVVAGEAVGDLDDVALLADVGDV